MSDQDAMHITQPGSAAAPAEANKPLFWVSRQAARWVLIALHVTALLAVFIEWFWPFDQDAHAVERVHALDFTGSYAVYGFVSCVILVLLGLVLRRLMMRPEDYYPDDRA